MVGEVDPTNHPYIYRNFDEARLNLGVSVNDLLNLNEYKRLVGRLGEKWVLDYETEKLKNTVFELEYWAEIDVTKGYDILSYDEQGQKIYIEVKSSIRFGEPFFISEHEFRVAKKLRERYYIYRVENVGADNSRKVVLTKYSDPTNHISLEYYPNGWKVEVRD